MARTRRNIWKLDETWNPTVLWYARAVKALKARDFATVTSWRYLAAMHGVDEGIWRTFGWLGPHEQLPKSAEFRKQDKDQCQHHAWFFIPWHRGYLTSFEAIVRAAIAELGGPADWALPYWNYSDAADANARKLPPAFATKQWPDGGDNPLFDSRRYGRGDGTIVLRDVDVAVSAALLEGEFQGSPGGSPGFGGAQTPFQHNADRKAEGLLEQVPHDVVHGRIGGSKKGENPADPRSWGLMSSPDTAALDPIFWLHHANIDRLWAVWLKRDERHANPVSKAWLDGPARNRPFIMPQPDGSRRQFTPREMLDTSAPALDYVYDDISDPLGGQHRLSMRLNTLRLAMAAAEVPVMPKKAKIELMGANAEAVRLGNTPTATTVKIDKPTAAKVKASFNALALAAGPVPEPDRVFMNLENITGTNDSAIFDVYVGLPPNADPATHPDHFAGVVSLFGVHNATNMAQPHGGAGLNKVIEITGTIDRLHLQGNADLSSLPVLFVATTDLGQGDIEIKRVSIYRQAH
jgi:tyrosinase